MATGYTAILNDNPETTFEKFALRCARGMGALIMMRDDDMDAPIPDDVGYKSTYNEDRLRQAEVDVVKFSAMDDASCDVTSEEEYQEVVVRYNESCDKQVMQARTYGAMLGEVLAWVPPTKDHQGIKDFMESQIKESIRFDCCQPTKPVKQSGSEWKAEKIASAIRNIEYHTKQIEEEATRNAERNEWVKALRQSLSR